MAFHQQRKSQINAEQSTLVPSLHKRSSRRMLRQGMQFQRIDILLYCRLLI